MTPPRKKVDMTKEEFVSSLDERLQAADVALVEAYREWSEVIDLLHWTNVVDMPKEARSNLLLSAINEHHQTVGQAMVGCGDLVRTMNFFLSPGEPIPVDEGTRRSKPDSK